MLKPIAWLIWPEWPSILFALRLVVAVSTAIYIAMWLQLGRPFWAGLEVALMIQFLPGNTVARAAARVGGTVVAGLAALLILALFQQTPELMIAALALWVAACTFALQFFRDNFSYAFGVIGFITGVIVMFTVSADGASAFGVAESRVAECCVAALTVAAVNVLFSSGLTVRRFYRARVSALSSVGQEIQALIAAARGDASRETSADPHPRLAALAKEVLALERLRPYVHLEHPG
ncbi:FUSC family protein [uncultured Salinisphaera sp.]|uniref:FUSC family protein n=1 Tax=uncultured Salinisphaera sp. TaxID=359372 RepID=UPI0032B18F51|tara:strand:+ start:2113 stop:2817 length:705 start_codon:yes stop_codon:yes gene_type:complete